jgi:hypothetical protein
VYSHPTPAVALVAVMRQDKTELSPRPARLRLAAWAPGRPQTASPVSGRRMTSIRGALQCEPVFNRDGQAPGLTIA